MRKLVLAAALGAASLSIAACGDRDVANNSAENISAEDAAVNGASTDTSAAAGTASTYPKGARIVEEKGVTYRIDPDGTRVTLGENDSRIVVEDGVRYRVDSGGTRVKIDDRGLDIDLPNVNLPDVDVGVNDKGNPDIDVKTKGDNNDGPDRYPAARFHHTRGGAPRPSESMKKGPVPKGRP